MSRFVMTLGLVSSLSVAWIALDPLAAYATAAATATTGTTGTTLNTLSTVGATASPQDAVNPAQLTSAQIAQIQNALNNAGFSVITTGRWDPATVSAVQQFQSSRTFVSNGLLTNQTLAGLGVNVNVSGTSFGTAAVNNATTFGVVDNTFNPNSLTPAQISELQQALRNRGFNVAVNGIFGPSTIAAIQQFEASQGRAATGTLTNQTVADLGLNLNTSAGTAPNLNTIAPAAGGFNGTATTNGSINTTVTGQSPTGATTFTPSTGTAAGTLSGPTMFNSGATTTGTSGTTTTTTGGTTGTAP